MKNSIFSRSKPIKIETVKFSIFSREIIEFFTVTSIFHGLVFFI